MLKQQLTDDMKQAMRDRDSLKLGVIRFLLSELKNYEIDHGEQDDAGVQTVLTKELKKIKDAMAEFAQAGRQDLVDEEEAKVAIIQSYLPEQLSEAEVEQAVRSVIATLDQPNLGQAMKAAMEQLKGKADGSLVSAVVKRVLSA